jgi:hypothetical protein
MYQSPGPCLLGPIEILESVQLNLNYQFQIPGRSPRQPGGARYELRRQEVAWTASQTLHYG